MNFNYDDYYRPCHDVVFAIMFSDASLFVKLCSAVYGQPIVIDGAPHSQAVIRENDVLLNSIRFDVLAIAADTKQIFTIDIQRRYTKGRQERRGVYYVCRAVSTQGVTDMKYEALHPVHISFILTDQQNAAGGIRKVGLCYLDTGALYDDLIELVQVYVPEILKASDAAKDNDLYVFSRFFAVNSQEEASAYAAEFETNNLAKELIRVYNASVANQQNLQAIENSPYFTQRLNEAQLAEARAEAKREGITEGKREGKRKGKREGKREERLTIAKNAMGMNMPISQIEQLTGLSSAQIEKLQRQLKESRSIME
jgi:predicted transposase/invertase (TIGR01784 family)